MPSIRVRRCRYNTMNEPPTGPQEPSGNTPGSLAAVFVPHWTATIPRPRSASETNAAGTSGLTDNISGSPVPQHGRPRAGSRVSHHVMNKGSTRFSKAPHVDRRSSQASLTGSVAQPGMIELEGSQAGVLVHSDGQSGVIGSALSLSRAHENAADGESHHHDDIVEHLDVIDTEVSVVSNLANAANALLIPPLSIYSRKPVLVLPSTLPKRGPDKEGHPGVLEDDLDRHVDDCLEHPSKFRRTMRGVWAFLKTPMGIITGIYGFLVVFWGAAIVLFLAKIINLHDANAQGFWVEVSSQIENGLFTVTGIGLIPQRVLDTYRISKIWYYKRRTRKLRAKAQLPQLYDIDDLPDPIYDPNYVHVLTEKDQDDLHKQQDKFQHSQTWYRPHGTETHRAFPIGTALLICCLVDGNSTFQAMLCGIMWSMNRFQRPAWATAILITLSFLCGILSGVFIWFGSQKTRRTNEVKERLRMALATEADLSAICEVLNHDGAGHEPKIRPDMLRISTAERTRPSPDRGATLDQTTTVDEHMLVPDIYNEKHTHAAP